VDASPICAGAIEKATQFQSEVCLLNFGVPAMISPTCCSICAAILLQQSGKGCSRDSRSPINMIYFNYLNDRQLERYRFPMLQLAAATIAA
jgi:hypothetical protein